MKLHLGVDLAFVRKRWAYGWEWAPIVRNQLGLKYVEFCSDLIDPVILSRGVRRRLAHEAKEASRKAGLTIYNMYTGLIPHCLFLLSHPDAEARKDGQRWCENLLKLSSLLGARGTGGHYDTIPYQMWKSEEKEKKATQNLIRSMVRLSEVAKRLGQEFLALEQMYTPNEKPHTLKESEEMLDEINERSSVPVYLTVDVGHVCSQNYRHSKADRDPLKWLEKFGARSPIIHLQQTPPEASHHWPFTKKYNAIGRIRPDEVVDALERSGSKENYLMLEIFFSLYVNEKTILREMEESVAYWRPYVTD